MTAVTLEALRVLDAIDRCGSFAAAAAATFKVPSALSYTIQKFENDLGTQLFDRTKQRASLTPAGRLVLEQGRKLLQAAGDIEEAVRQLESGWETQLRVAKDTILPIQPILERIKAFNDLNRPVSIQVSEEVLGGAWDALVSGRAHIALGGSGDLPKGLFEFRQLGEVEFVFAVAPDHPLTQHPGPIDATAIRAYPTVVVADTSITAPPRSSGLLESRQEIRVASMAVKLEAQRLGIGVGFLPRHLAAPLIARGALVDLPCAVPRSSQPLYMAWRKGQRGKALAWFVEAFSTIAWL